MVFLSDLQRHIAGQISLSEPLGRYTSFGVGGTADYFVVPASKEDFVRTISSLRESALPFFLLAPGSNLLVSDVGFRGAAVMLDPGLAHMNFEAAAGAREGGEVYAEAGIRLGTFVEFCVQRSLRGPEVLAGKRGTLGGWVVKNCGRMDDPFAATLMGVDILRDGKLTRLKNMHVGVAGRSIDSHRDIVLAATFRLPAGDQEEIMRARREWLIRNNTVEPVNIAHAGGIFKDPQGRGAAELIENSGLKGRRHGGAQISERNANLLVASTGATASELRALIDIVQRRVNRKHHILLELKVKLVGFEHQSLQKVA